MPQSVLSGSRLSLTRLLTQVENGTDEGRQALSELFPHTGKAHLLGVTGAPGTGKSSLVNQLALHYRQETDPPRRVAIVAVDPSSPFTGGAVLGDRVRMKDLAGDPDVFIRSMASRGSLGGLAQATAAVVQVFDSAGFDVIMIETVGAGQSEVDIARLVHTTLVVEAPGMGDDIQAIKAGILEIADILVINKADRPGVEATERALKAMLELAHPVKRVFRHHGQDMEVPVQKDAPGGGLWLSPVLKTISTSGQGIPELAGAIEQHRSYLLHSGDWVERDRSRLRAELDTLIQNELLARFRRETQPAVYEQALALVLEREKSPWEVVRELVNGSHK
ncbi:MAG: methylmalonyl Co-A mutase-associated GTPase MeaB [Anaerolineales bacterium]|nr:methylmalonyl Co-A mutase-associated GTPase MeaB [Anaerolineales bacterium]